MKFLLIFFVISYILNSSILTRKQILQQRSQKERLLSKSGEQPPQNNAQVEISQDQSAEQKNSKEQINEDNNEIQALEKTVSNLDDEFFYIFHNQRRIKYYHKIRIEIFQDIYKFMYGDEGSDEVSFEDFLEKQVKEIFEGQEIKISDIQKLDYKDYKDKIYILYSNDMRFRIARIKFFTRIGGDYKFEQEPAERILTQELQLQQQDLSKLMKDSEYKNLDPFIPVGYKSQKLSSIPSPLSINVEDLKKDIQDDESDNLSSQDEVDSQKDEIVNPLDDQSVEQEVVEDEPEGSKTKGDSTEQDKKKKYQKFDLEGYEQRIFNKKKNVAKQKQFIKVTFDNPINETQFDVQYYPFIQTSMRTYLKNTITNFMQVTYDLVYTADQLKDNVLEKLEEEYGNENSDQYYKIEVFNPVYEENPEKIQIIQQYVKQFSSQWPEQYDYGVDENNFILFTLHSQNHDLPDLELIIVKGQIDNFYDRQFERIYFIWSNEQFLIQEAFGLNVFKESQLQFLNFLTDFKSLFFDNFVQLGVQRIQRCLNNEELKKYNILKKKKDKQYDIFFEQIVNSSLKTLNYESKVRPYVNDQNSVIIIKLFPCISQNNASTVMLNSYSQRLKVLNKQLAVVPAKYKPKTEESSESKSIEQIEPKKKPQVQPKIKLKQEKKQVQEQSSSSEEQEQVKKNKPQQKKKQTVPDKITKKKEKKDIKEDVPEQKPQQKPQPKQKKKKQTPVMPKKPPVKKKPVKTEDDPNKPIKEQIKKKQAMKQKAQREQIKAIQNIQNNVPDDDKPQKQAEQQEDYYSDYMQFHPEPIITPNKISNLHVKHDLLNNNMPLMFYSLFKKI